MGWVEREGGKEQKQCVETSVWSQGRVFVILFWRGCPRDKGRVSAVGFLREQKDGRTGYVWEGRKWTWLYRSRWAVRKGRWGQPSSDLFIHTASHRQAHLRDTAGSVPGHSNKANIIIKAVTPFGGFPSANICLHSTVVYSVCDNHMMSKSCTHLN